MSTKADMAIAFHDKGYNCAPVSYTHLTLPTTS